ncbi:MAG: DUF3035 domain-containing protein [Defluviicoccus sp.]|uniref:DUF3035 domain-containing protein n=2 Tax=root TaxID=1 RepID=A0A564WIM5_9PROT|nr:DUF3035 domain-containing protein [Defluviicoccus sp.]SUS08550.1 conserved exported hypothetical protein [uncultured Defluviicoccus sp.]VUX47433.1 conserved exported hypothetical protein [Candidatus Defluviicoccus seviourii]
MNTVRGMRLLLGIAMAATLTACENTKSLLGQSKRSPDEYAVYSRVPLSMPPEYGMRPPGSAGPVAGQPGSPTSEARDVLLGREPGRRVAATPSVGADGLSGGTMALLERTGGLNADPAIRTRINRETTVLAEVDQSFTDRLMFWRTPTEYGTVVDPNEEAKRIRENQALGKPVTDGRTPTIARRKRALLEGIFN